MTGSSIFEAQVQEALAHLYDVGFLERASLAERVGQPRQRGGGATLHRQLVEAIERLKPPREVVAEAMAWKIYRVLHLRYVRSLSASAVASELGLSTRQSQRIHAAAIAAVATVLAEARGAGAVELPTPTAPAQRPEVVPTDLLLDDELATVLAQGHAEYEALPATLRGAIQTVSPMLEARGVAAEVAIDDAVARRIAPRDLVHPALVQLLLAALDWGHARAVVATLSAYGADIALRLSVEPDEGRGAPPDGAAELDRRLAVARRLLAVLDGRVTAEPAPTLRIEARLRAELAPVVLVVEDNPQVVQLFRRYLSGSPYAMAWAPNGSVAFELAGAERPDAITLDLLLPQRDGWEFLQAARVHPLTREIPVIVCSVLRERELALALGAADFLAKPVTQHTLLSALRRHVRPSRPEPRPPPGPTASC